MISSTLIDQLKKDEGCRLNMYKCPAGFDTIGYGHNLEACPNNMGMHIPHTITQAYAEMLLAHDIERIEEALERRWPFFKKITGQRREALLNMAFQMGSAGLMKFKKMIAAIEDDHWDRACIEAVQSSWYQQTPERARRVIEQLREA